MTKTLTKAKRRATPKPKPTRHVSNGRAAGDVRVRMYRQGLGDCFLLTFPKKSGGDFHILIDCGVILGTPNPKPIMEAVARDIIETTGGHLDILVATHEHWDHVSGFDQAKDKFDGIKVDRVWLAWTEDPKDATANRIRKERGMRLAALWLGTQQMRQFGAADPEAAETVERVAEVLSFFGIDPDHDQPPAGGFGAFEAAAAAAGGKTGAAMRWVRDKVSDPEFWKPGDVIDLLAEIGIRVYVLGPPTDRTLLGKDLPTSSGHETYEMRAAAARAFFSSAFGASDPYGMRQDFDPSIPFDQKYQISRAAADQIDFFRDHYLGTSGESPDDWRRIDRDWMAGATDFALQLDSDTNNTSLALAFELDDGRVLLFPGDAQVGNWESWHVDGDHTRVWNVDNGKRQVTAEQLLNRTVLYKVGHHGSHNATLREKGLEMMTDPDLVAMVPVDVYIAHKKKRWTRMPFHPLMTRLADVTKGRVLQADEEASGLATSASDALRRFSKRVKDSGKQITVTGSSGKPVDRPLYVDYFLTTSSGRKQHRGAVRSAKPSSNGAVRTKTRRRHRPSRTK
jgi:hypothetical protein